jgi:hypothetical protein
MKRVSVLVGAALVSALAAAAWCRGTASATAPGTRPATTRAATAPTTAAAELHAQILDKYIAAKWDTLATDLAKTKDINAMTKDQQADVAYVKQAVADGRPAWWDSLKQGRKTIIQTRIWQKTLNLTWDPALTPGSINMSQTPGGPIAISVNWLSADMDSTEIAEHGFTKGDLAYVGIWGAMEAAQLYGVLSVQQVNNLNEKDRTKLSRFMGFRQAVAAAYYGTPRARRWISFLAFDGYIASHLTNEGFIPRRGLAVMLEQEIVSHPARYPSLRIPRNLTAETAETNLATNLMGQFERTTLTFAEDKALREAVKEFAQANTQTIYAGGKITLPSKLTLPLDPSEDGDGPAKRGTWLLEEIAHPGVHAEAASKPATKPSTATKPTTKP